MHLSSIGYGALYPVGKGFARHFFEFCHGNRGTGPLLFAPCWYNNMYNNREDDFIQERIMTLKYTYEMDGDFIVGHLDDYPEYPTQGENLQDFEENLLDIYNMIQKGTLEANQKHSINEKQISETSIRHFTLSHCF
jgi:hypothetical protein